MLKKQQRVTAAEFNSCFQTGRRVHGRLCTLVYCPNVAFKAAAVVGKKLARRAVDRNRQRRRIYSALRRVRDQGVAKGTFLVLAKAPLLSATAAEIGVEIDNLIGRTQKSR